ISAAFFRSAPAQASSKAAARALRPISSINERNCPSIRAALSICRGVFENSATEPSKAPIRFLQRNRARDARLQYHIVAVHQGRPALIAEDFRNLTRAMPGNLLGLGAGIAAKALGQSHAFGRQDRHRLAAAKTAAD